MILIVLYLHELQFRIVLANLSQALTQVRLNPRSENLPPILRQGDCTSSAGKSEELHQVGNAPPSSFAFNFQGAFACLSPQQGQGEAVQERHVLCRCPIIDTPSIFTKHHIY